MTENKREIKGKQIALKSDLLRLSDYHYHVHSQTTKRDYDVIKVSDKWICSCPDHTFRHVCCKHIHAVDGKTPADMCGIEIQGNNKWKTIIENASM